MRRRLDLNCADHSVEISALSAAIFIGTHAKIARCVQADVDHRARAPLGLTIPRPVQFQLCAHCKAMESRQDVSHPKQLCATELHVTATAAVRAWHTVLCACVVFQLCSDLRCNYRIGAPHSPSSRSPFRSLTQSLPPTTGSPCFCPDGTATGNTTWRRSVTWQACTALELRSPFQLKFPFCCCRACQRL